MQNMFSGKLHNQKTRLELGINGDTTLRKLYWKRTILTLTIFLFQVPPSFVSKPENTTVVEGEDVRFKCNATGNPKPLISWFLEKNGSLVSLSKTSKHQIGEDNFTLEIKNVQRDQTGRYVCEAKNEIGNTSTSVYLNVQCKYVLFSISTKNPFYTH